MAESTMTEKLKRSKPGETQEDTNSLTGPAGVYVHPGSGEELIVRYDPLLGNTQAEAAIRVGFVWKRDVKPDEVKELATPSLQHAADEGARTGESGAMKGVQSRLDALEAENARLRAAQPPQTQTELSQAEAIAAADKQTADRGTDNAGAVTTSPNIVGGVGDAGNVGDTTSELNEKALSKQNKTELLATAEAEGVTDVSSENSNKELVNAIEAKRAESGDEGGNE